MGEQPLRSLLAHLQETNKQTNREAHMPSAMEMEIPQVGAVWERVGL